MITDTPVSSLDIDQILQFCSQNEDTKHIEISSFLNSFIFVLFHLSSYAISRVFDYSKEMSSLYPPAMLGYLLGYPTIYSNSFFISSATSPPSSNCLSMQCLKLYKIILLGFTPNFPVSANQKGKRYKKKREKEFFYFYSSLMSFSLESFSNFEAVCFSFPACINVNMAIFLEKLNNIFSKQNIWTDYKIDVTEVCLEHVLL